jgi:predicted nucleotidyltransferase component of viral defense system
VNPAYLESVELLLDAMPAVFRRPHFALKGGTAINLFLLDMPRLSVDIDVVYTRHDLPRTEALQDIANSLSQVAVDLERQGLSAQLAPASDDLERKILVTRGRTRIKIEVNTVIRGTVMPVVSATLLPQAQAAFRRAVDVPMLAPAELYAGKLVAALDRQHPRDLFDVAQMLSGRGISDDLRRCFVVYLASSNRPPHELLPPRPKDIQSAFENEFQGMTNLEVRFDDLLATRTRLVETLPQLLPADSRRFLMSLIEGEPIWDALAIDHARELPALQWKLRNVLELRTRNRAKHQASVDELKRRLADLRP